MRRSRPRLCAENDKLLVLPEFEFVEGLDKPADRFDRKREATLVQVFPNPCFVQENRRLIAVADELATVFKSRCDSLNGKESRKVPLTH